jgi:hypothetical protein
VIVQAGSYAEHQFTTVCAAGAEKPVNGSFLTVRLQPGAGGRLVLKMRRYVNRPTMAFPWERGVLSR